LKCKSCSAEINPKFKHAIDKNVCPFCGDQIFDEELKELLSALNVIVTDLSNNYKDDLDEWLYSNLNMVEVNSERFNSMLPKHNNTSSKEVVKRYLPESSDYFNNPEVKEAMSKQEKAKEIVNKIKGNSQKPIQRNAVEELTASVPSRSPEEIAKFYGVPVDMVKQASPEVLAEYEQGMSGGTSAIDTTPTESVEEELPGIIQRMVTRANKNNMSSKERDIERAKRLMQKQNSPLDDSSSGSFRRV